ncbi:hypothetical protein BLNAU_10489 [Blattamonas nauphoetae]|uniref:Uncharacterized protein n=1 Tax=Blattamonas nauphoetae TaxID=2049346 RepID=A0ABQ9XQF8_9EUKA|nr:hypothetical protein BLNAU_10489 [Blattamonas nauphoetae]
MLTLSLPSFWSWNARTLSPHSGHGMLALSPLILVMECSHSLPSFWSWNAHTLSPLILVMECSHSLPSFWSWNARTLSPHSGHGMLALSPLILVMECSHSLPSFWSWNARTLSPHSGHGMLTLSPLILVMECSHSLPSFWSWNARTLSPHSGHGMLALSPLILVMECSHSLPSFWSWNAHTLSPHSGHGMLALSPLILVMECSDSLPSFWSWNARTLSPHSGHGMLAVSNALTFSGTDETPSVGSRAGIMMQRWETRLVFDGMDGFEDTIEQHRSEKCESGGDRIHQPPFHRCLGECSRNAILEDSTETEFSVVSSPFVSAADPNTLSFKSQVALHFHFESRSFDFAACSHAQPRAPLSSITLFTWPAVCHSLVVRSEFFSFVSDVVRFKSFTGFILING